MLKKIFSFLLIFCFVFTLILGSKNVYADETSSKTLSYSCNVFGEDYFYQLSNAPADTICVGMNMKGSFRLAFYSLSPFSSSVLHYTKFVNGELKEDVSGNATDHSYTYTSDYGTRCVYYTGGYEAMLSYFGGYSGYSLYVNCTSYEDGYEKICEYLIDGRVSDGMEIISNNESSSDLGYLQNIQCTTLVKNAYTDTSNEYAGEKKYKFSYSLTTSTGFDLRSSGADVEYCIKIKGGYTTLLNDYKSLPTVVSDCLSAGNGNFNFYIESGVLNELYSSFRSDASMMAKTIDSQIYIYMRPIQSENGVKKYGGWSRIKFDKGNIQVSQLTVDNGTTSTGAISSEADGEEDDFVIENSTTGNSSYGSGSDFEEAESNASSSNTNSSNWEEDETLEYVKSYVQMIGEWPVIIGSIFSFLPDWVLGTVSVSFALILFLIIYKLVRG